MFGAQGWTQSGANYLKAERRRIIGKAHHQMASSMAGTADQAKPEPEPAQTAIAAGRLSSLAWVFQVQNEEVHQLGLRRGLTFDDPE